MSQLALEASLLEAYYRDRPPVAEPRTVAKRGIGRGAPISLASLHKQSLDLPVTLDHPRRRGDVKVVALETTLLDRLMRRDDAPRKPVRAVVGDES